MSLVDRDRDLADEFLGQEPQRVLGVVVVALLDLHHHDRVRAGAFEVFDLAHVVEAVVAQELVRGRRAADVAHLRALARRQLAEDRQIDRLLLHGDRGHVHEEAVVALRHVARELAERAFHFEHVGRHRALDHDLGFGRHHQVLGHAAHHVERTSRHRAGDVVFAHVVGNARHRRVGDVRRRADHDRGRHALDALLAPAIDVVAHADAEHAGQHADAVLRLHHAAVVAEIVDAVVRVLRDPMRRRRVGRVVEARRRDRNRQPPEPAALARQFVAGDDDLLAGPFSTRVGVSGFASACATRPRSPRSCSPCRARRCRPSRPARRPAPGIG